MTIAKKICQSRRNVSQFVGWGACNVQDVGGEMHLKPAQGDVGDAGHYGRPS